MNRVPPVTPVRSFNRFRHNEKRHERQQQDKNEKHEAFRKALVEAVSRDIARNELPAPETRLLAAARDWLHDLTLETATKQAVRPPTQAMWQDDKLASYGRVDRRPGVMYDLFTEFAARDEVWVWWVVTVYDDGVKTRKAQGFASTRHKAKLEAEKVVL